MGLRADFLRVADLFLAADINGVIGMFFKSEIDNGNSDAAATIDWSQGTKQKIVLSANTMLTFLTPGGTSNLLLRLTQDGVGGRTVTWPASIKWSGGAPPLLTAAANAVDIVALFFNGTNYYGVASLNFA